MRYLKKFTENKDEYYVVSRTYYPTSTKVNISKQSVHYITSLFNGICRGSSFKGYEYRYDVDNREFTDINYLIIFKSNNYGCILKIYEMEDEYFHVVIYPPSDGRPLAGKGDEVFKCDQVDGVRELLIDKGIIK